MKRNLGGTSRKILLQPAYKVELCYTRASQSTQAPTKLKLNSRWGKKTCTWRQYYLNTSLPLPRTCYHNMHQAEPCKDASLPNGWMKQERLLGLSYLIWDPGFVHLACTQQGYSFIFPLSAAQKGRDMADLSPQQVQKGTSCYVLWVYKGILVFLHIHVTSF